jgi:Cd2+/Zn2+-exporting ATPase
MIVAAFGAAAVGEPREGAVLMFLFSLSNTLETYAMGRTHASIRALLDMTPKEAELYRDNQIVRVPVEELRVGDLVLVRPGAQIPADGQVVEGESAVDEASITGESLPVEKAAGARVFAGTLNRQGALDVRVTTAVENSTLARIVAVVREAREQKAHSQDFTDRVIGQYYAYAVIGITLLAILIPLVFLGWDLRTTFYRAMTLMVVASPCAVVISIPAALLSALASAARGGVLLGRPLPRIGIQGAARHLRQDRHAHQRAAWCGGDHPGWLYRRRMQDEGRKRQPGFRPSSFALGPRR